MTLAPQTPTTPPAESAAPPAPPADLVGLTVDGFEVSVPKGTLVIRAAELLGIEVPRFCDHPLLDPIGACRQCIVEVEGQRKPLTACTTTVTEGMVVRTQLTSPMAAKAQAGTLELLLINHPLDCPVCDKGGECPLQNQTMSNGHAQSRFGDVKRTYPKPIPVSAEVLLDRERCVLCARCTRFSLQIAGDPFIEMFERGAMQQVAVEESQPFASYFSGNTVQICPVGALTSASYRFRARPFDLVSTPSVCEHCASGCALRVDHRRGRVTRRLAGHDPAVNEEWNCDKGRWAFAYATAADRITTPLLRGEDGELEPVSWSRALEAAAAGLAAARGRAAALPGGRLTVEDAYAYAKFTRLALGSDDVDFRVRAHSAEEARWLAANVAGRGQGVTYADLERAPEVLLVGLEPEEESPILFLRLRKASRGHRIRIRSVGAVRSAGVLKCGGELVGTVPGAEPATLDGLSVGPGALVLVGERLAEVAGGFAALDRLVARCGARVAWVPRRAGERGALDAGALPGLLPGGRLGSDPAARAELESVWGSALPTGTGRDTTAILAAATSGDLAALVVGGVDPADLPDPGAALGALDAVGFLVSLELRHSAVTERADVVLPVAPAQEKAGTFLDWEGRPRPFPAVFDTGALSDLRVLHVLAGEMGVALGLPDVPAARAELAALAAAAPAAAPGFERAPAAASSGPVPAPGPGEAVLACHPLLLDEGRLQDGEPHLAATAKAPRALLSAATAAGFGLVEGDPVTLSGVRGSVTLPVAVAEMVDGVVWAPAHASGARVRGRLGLPGSIVRVRKGG
jgi:NADH-quinone oxidoreductase subunit G